MHVDSLFQLHAVVGGTSSFGTAKVYPVFATVSRRKSAAPRAAAAIRRHRDSRASAPIGCSGEVLTFQMQPDSLGRFYTPSNADSASHRKNGISAGTCQAAAARLRCHGGTFLRKSRRRLTRVSRLTGKDSALHSKGLFKQTASDAVREGRTF